MDGKIALVIGGTSGVGLATAKQFIREGAHETRRLGSARPDGSGIRCQVETAPSKIRATSSGPPALRCTSKPAERLFEFIRASDGALIDCELRFRGETYGWEVVFYERGGEFFARGGFVTRALAVLWAERERDAMTHK